MQVLLCSLPYILILPTYVNCVWGHWPYCLLTWFHLSHTIGMLEHWMIAPEDLMDLDRGYGKLCKILTIHILTLLPSHNSFISIPNCPADLSLVPSKNISCTSRKIPAPIATFQISALHPLFISELASCQIPTVSRFDRELSKVDLKNSE